MINISDVDFQRLVSHMYKKYGINLEKKRVLIEGRLNGVLMERGYDNYTDFLNMVFADRTGKEMNTIINKLTTNHTYFMREPEHYKFMREVFLPSFEQNPVNKTIDIWSAGCSSGEEPYTIAMVLDEFFGSKKPLWNTKILATDISNNVLTKAKDGIYQKEGLKDISPMWITKYFQPKDEKSYTINKKIKNEIIFKEFNLMNNISFGKKFDLIFCRNVMIYFDLETKTKLINRFFDVTKPGGYLFIGHAESVQRGATGYDYVKPAIYRKPL